MKTPYVLVIGGLLAIVVVLGGWYTFSNPQIAAAFGFHPGPQGTSMASTTPNGMRMRGGFATGSIESLSGDALTLTLQDGSTKNVTLTATTSLRYYATASSTPATTTIDQLSVGEQVSVMGSTQADGSIVAMRLLAGTLPQHTMGQGRMGSSTWQGGTHAMGGAPGQGGMMRPQGSM